jgi:FAD/FMN-containing dehydrogenase
MTIAPGDSRLAGRLRNEIRGGVLFSRADRGRYATDASIYQVEPIGVVVPEEIGDVAATMAIAREEGIPVLPRGGGTSQCGQTVNRALVIDCSKHLRGILDIDPEARTALVEPGLVLGHLNAALRQHGLFFPVDPSTHARCTIGGMAGNNSCGSKSIRYGLMADNVRAIARSWRMARSTSSACCPTISAPMCRVARRSDPAPARWAPRKPRRLPRAFLPASARRAATTSTY